MEQLKTTFREMSPMVAFIAHATAAFLFFLFFLILPVFGSGYGAMNGIKVIGHLPAGTILMSLLFISAPFGIMVYTCIKHKVMPCMVMALAYTFFIFMMSSNLVWGVGAYINILLILIPWSMFAYLRGDAKTWVA